MFQDQNNSLEEPIMAANTDLIFGKISKTKKIPNRKSKASLAIGIS